MRKKHCVRWIMICLAVFFVAFVLEMPCPAAEFTADMTINAGGQVMKGKIFVKGHRYRQEMNAMGQKQVMIFDGNKEAGWILMPDAHMYMDLPKMTQGDNPQVDPKELEKKATKKYLGEEAVNGHKCKKYLFVFKDSPGTQMTQWVSTRLEYPIRMIVEGQHGRMVREIKNIKETAVSNALFTVPQGYQKMSIPGMPGMNLNQ
jgi:outer membrane lipoprotein-sorting protein